MGKLSDTATVANSPEFLSKLTAALAFRARAILAGNTAPPLSLSYAATVARNPKGHAELALWMIATDPTVVSEAAGNAANVTETAIDDAVGRAWSYLARLSS